MEVTFGTCLPYAYDFYILFQKRREVCFDKVNILILSLPNIRLQLSKELFNWV